MTTSKKSTDKRTDLKNKIAAAEQRNADRSFGDYARGARDGATSFVKEHPIATLAGGLALGAIVASLLPGPGRRMRKKASARGALVAGTIADLALTYGAQFLDGAGKAAKAGQERASDLGETLGDSARSASRGAGRTISDLRSRFH
jgi:hypothetical protein